VQHWGKKSVVCKVRQHPHRLDYGGDAYLLHQGSGSLRELFKQGLFWVAELPALNLSAGGDWIVILAGGLALNFLRGVLASMYLDGSWRCPGQFAAVRVVLWHGGSV
jgi:hypothetical protein